MNLTHNLNQSNRFDTNFNASDGSRIIEINESGFAANSDCHDFALNVREWIKTLGGFLKSKGADSENVTAGVFNSSLHPDTLFTKLFNFDGQTAHDFVNCMARVITA